jgi:hypothetical protein
MATEIKDIINNTKRLYMSDSSLENLMDFERVLDELDIYIFDNWQKGELVDGPRYEKYFVTCSFMWPYKLMPDPRGGERLLDYNARITYKKDTLSYPVEVKSYDDFKPGTKVPKLAKKPIWIVTITLPKQLMKDIHQGSLELESETIDVEDIEQAYEVGLEDEVYKENEDENEQQQTAQMGMGMPGGVPPGLPTV